MRMQFYSKLAVVIVGFLSTGSVTANLVLGQEKGDRVVVASSNARLDNPGGPSESLEPGTVLEVRGARGSWLRVANGQVGWIPKNTVVALADAEAHFQAKITSSTAEVGDFHALAQLRSTRAGWEDGIAVYDAALKTFPDSALVYFNRGMTYSKNGKIKEAIADYEKSIELDGTMVAAMNNLAWILATGDAEFRNGDKALELAAKARELTKERDGAVLDTLAAANAEAGRFADAMKWQIAAIRLKDRGPAADPLYARLKLYAARRAYHVSSQ